MSAAKVGLNGRSNEALPLIVAWLTGWVAMVLVGKAVDTWIAMILPGVAVDTPGPMKWGSALVAMMTVLLLGCYYYARRERLNIDRASDALYYLGLLLTLGSLIWSLVTPIIDGESKNDLSARANEIIGNFGIALVSTVAGIVGRIILQSFAGQDQQTPAEKEVQDRHLHGDVAEQNQKTSASVENGTKIHAIDVNRELNLMAQHLRRQMREAADAFSAFNRATMQEAEATRSAALRYTEDVRKRLEEMAQATIKTVEEAHREMVDRFRETGEALEQRVEAADKVAHAMLNQAASTREKVEAVTTYMERERLGLEGIGETIRREIGAASEALSVLPENVTRTSEAIDGLQATVIQAGETLKEMTEETQRNHETLRKDAEEREKELVRWIERSRRDTDREIQVWVNHVTRTNEAIDGLQATVIRAGETLKEMTEETQHSHEMLRKDTEERERGIVRQIEQNRRDIDQEIRAWSDHVERTARALKTASEGSESLEEVVERMRTSCEQLATLAETLNVAETSIRTLGQAAEATARKVEQQ